LHALAHPLWWVAAILLALNDHLLKGALPELSMLTGKLSDVAGLLVAPFLLAVLIGARSRAAVIACHVATGAVFAAINLSTSAAAGMELATAWTPWPWAIMVDPTDLIALPALLISWRVFSVAAAQDVDFARRRLATAAILPAGVVCMATSPAPGPEPQPPGQFFGLEAELVIGNDTPREQVVRVRALKSGVQVDCMAARENVGFAFTRELFAPAQSFIVQAQGLVPLFQSGVGSDAESRACRVFLVDGSDFDMRLLFWMATEFPTQFIEGNGSTRGTDRIIRVTGDVRGAARWDDAHRAVNPPPGAAGDDNSSCGLGGAERSVAWTTPLPVGTWTITSTVSSPDGCYGLALERSGRWYVCLGGGDLPFGRGEEITVEEVTEGASGLAITGVSITSSISSVVAAQGLDLVKVDEGVELSVPEVNGSCPRARTKCGGYAAPLSVELRDGTNLAAGEEAQIADGVLSLLRAFELKVFDTACYEGQVVNTRLIESVFVKNGR